MKKSMTKPVVKYTGDAFGVRGMLLRKIDGTYFLRVRKNGKRKNAFVDYELHHDDLSITITDELASFYKVGDRNILDHSPKVLGYKIDRNTKVVTIQKGQST